MTNDANPTFCATTGREQKSGEKDEGKGSWKEGEERKKRKEERKKVSREEIKLGGGKKKEE